MFFDYRCSHQICSDSSYFVFETFLLNGRMLQPQQIGSTYDILALTAKIRKKLPDVNKRPYVNSHIEEHPMSGPVDTNF